MEKYERSDISNQQNDLCSEESCGSGSLDKDLRKDTLTGCDQNIKDEQIIKKCNELEAQGTGTDGDLDPRIQIELEKLNSSTDVINKLELDLEEARSTFRHLLGESGRHLNQLYKDLGTYVEKARCYYDARMKARLALSEAQRAAARFEKASAAHDAAKEMVTLAEEGFQERGVAHFDQAWQEMLNHATKRVNENEYRKNWLAEQHWINSNSYEAAEEEVSMLYKRLKRSICKSRPYFEAKARLNQSLDDQKRQIQLIEETIQMTKVGYADSLKQLEKISEEIHERRKGSNRIDIEGENIDKDKIRNSLLGTRQDGVGAEFPSPCPAGKIFKKQLSTNNAVTRGEKHDVARKFHKHQRKEQIRPTPELNSKGRDRNQSDESNSDSERTLNQSSKIKSAIHGINSPSLIGGSNSISKNHKLTNNIKLKKKKLHKLPTKGFPNNSTQEIGSKEAINQVINKIQTSEDKGCKVKKKTHLSESQDKKTSISSNLTKESIDNDMPTPISIPSNRLNNSGESSTKSSSNSSSTDLCSSESHSQDSSPKLCYARLSSSTITTDMNKQVITDASYNDPSSANCKSNLELPIHSFNKLSVLEDQTNKEDKQYDETNVSQSFVKKKNFSPTTINNKYLHIKQEESELSDAESIASLDPLDDSQIEQLMKDVSIQQAAEELLHSPEN